MATEFQPYVGPRPFERDDQASFFGRDHEAYEFVSLIISSREVLCYAQSGVGKTSLLNAKVIPLLEEEGFEVLPLARVQGVIPKGIQPEEIQNIYVFNTLMCWAKHETNPGRLTRMTISEFLNERKRPTDNEGQPVPRALIFDQFEEIFTLYQDRWNDRYEFFKQVRDALKDDNRLLRVIFTIREDYIAQLDPYAPRLPEKLRTRFRLERLRRDAALSAITGPLRETNRSFAKGVAEKLVEDLMMTRVETITGETKEVTGEFVEPVQLQVVCQNLWQELPSDVSEITEDHLSEFGGVDRPLSRFYENAVKSAATEAGIDEGVLREWCEKWLITSTGTRGIVHRGRQLTEGIPNSALGILEARHLINSEWRAGARWYELTHDRLIEPIRTSNERWKQHGRDIEDYDRVLELDPKNVDAYYGRGSTYYNLEEYENAIADYDRVLELDPKYVNAYLFRGYTYLWLREIKQAQLDYIRSFQIDSTNVNYGLMTEWVNMCLEKPGPQTAGRLGAIASNDPENDEAYVCRGVALWIRGSFEKAETELNRAISLNPELEDSYFWKGMVLAYLGQNDDAITAIEKSLELDLPPLLLSPLRWIEHDRPDFYRKYAAPLLARFKI